MIGEMHVCAALLHDAAGTRHPSARTWFIEGDRRGGVAADNETAQESRYSKRCAWCFTHVWQDDNVAGICGVRSGSSIEACVRRASMKSAQVY